MRALLRAVLLIALALAPAAQAWAQADPPARMRIPRTSPRADDGPVRLRPALEPVRSSVTPPPPTAASFAPPALGASRLSRRPIGGPASYVVDRTGATCRTTCSTQRYQCLAGDDPDGCGAPWAQCIASCSQVADSSRR